MLTTRVEEQAISALAKYGSVPSRFLVRSVLVVRVVENGLGGWRLTERHLAVPYEKDYGHLEPPARWARQWDLANRTILAAHEGESRGRLGGAVLAPSDGPASTCWRGGRGWWCSGASASTLWRAGAASGAGSSGPRYGQRGGGAAAGSRSPTQNTNVGTCRLHAHQGCQLRGIHPGAYPEFPDEVQLLWYYDLAND